MSCSSNSLIPPPSPFWLTQHNPTPYEVKLLSAPPDYLTNIPTLQPEISVFKPVYYFFYGTLTQPSTLQRILGLKEEPVLRNAHTVGYSVERWGDYPTLINGPQGNVISGYAYRVQSAEDEEKLTNYETLAYRAAGCAITFDDEDGQQKQREVLGRTFVYAGDPAALREKRFDRKLWLRQARTSGIK